MGPLCESLGDLLRPPHLWSCSPAGPWQGECNSIPPGGSPSSAGGIPIPLLLAHRDSLLDRPRTKPLLAPSLAVPRECPLPTDSRAFAPISSESELPSAGSAPVFHGQSSWPAQSLPFKWDGQRSSSSLLCPLKCRRYILSLKRSYSQCYPSCFEMKEEVSPLLLFEGRFTEHQPLSSKFAPLTWTTLSPLKPTHGAGEGLRTASFCLLCKLCTTGLHLAPGSAICYTSASQLPFPL